MSLRSLSSRALAYGKLPTIKACTRSTPAFIPAFKQIHTSMPHSRKASDDDTHEKPYSTPVFNQTYPAEAPTSDTIVPVSMLDAFNNMFDRGPNVGVEIITKNGFVLSNNVRVDGPIILLNGTAFMWNVPAGAKSPFENWTEEMLKIFEVTAPKPELILFGTGKNFYPLPENLRTYLFKLGIQVDQMSTKNAASTYNVLAEEGRRIAAAMLPNTPTDAVSGKSIV
ncbi:hypothetical protein K450DRAFT_231980 [Umbelopsis ramanniana AG]|uniref:NADH dehydrogenase [ubiquinone] 1 alpha subcomplex assembly factor 3 n=1 Tax=Umbelopsis ramanniana AG TaxID=1314678 RepID=A0AAD5ED82_UMBRA|nr:uncharacterized protein K450DRAFT_231980 [Umbelopsis ramanniana AG]KAI8581573.1 hypothetical protein K450DRAFT_231980 [Umbelopsis ramanniana AG]